MSGDTVARIEKLENGYEVEICDPKVQEANRKPKTEWKDPWKGYAFTTKEEVITFLTEHLDSLKPPPDADEEYDSAFAQEASKDD
jgi:hypothetical protein